MMKVIILILLLFTVNAKSATLQKCSNLFKAEKYAQVIRLCEPIQQESADAGFIYFASNMFLDINYSRINHIFYYGKSMGSFLYKHKTGKNLYTNLEKYHLSKYFPELAEFADKGIMFAQLLTAKVFYINIDIIKQGEQEESSSELYAELDAGMEKYYLPNLENIIAIEPDHVEALALLGLESFEAEYIEGQYGTKVMYYSIKNEKLYTYLLRAHELGHPGLQEVIDGVAAWNKHLQGLNNQASRQDPQAIYLLGQNAWTKSHHDERFLDEALEYFQQAANLGHIDALRSLNSMYGSERYDREKYLSTLKQLIEYNDTKAMVRLGDIYLCNDRVAEAQVLYEKAVALKDPIAPYALDDLKHLGEPSSGC